MADVPVSTLKEAVPLLRRPFTPEAVRFKVQTVFSGGSGCLVVAYIDARLASERLNHVCPDLWHAAYQRVEGQQNFLWCHLTIAGTTRSDVGESTKGFSKDVVSDALKRAAVHFGVGVSLYAIPQAKLFTGKHGSYIKAQQITDRRSGKEKWTVDLLDAGHEALRTRYGKWLDEHGIQAFGEPLDHGDVEGQNFDPDVQTEDAAPESFQPAAPPPLEDQRARELMSQARGIYDRIGSTPAGRRSIPPAQFDGWLSGARHSHDELERLVAHLEARYQDLTRTAA